MRLVTLPDDESTAREVPLTGGSTTRRIKYAVRPPLGSPGFAGSFGFCNVLNDPIYDYGSPLYVGTFSTWPDPTTDQYGTAIIVEAPGIYHLTFGTPDTLMSPTLGGYRTLGLVSDSFGDPYGRPIFWSSYPYVEELLMTPLDIEFAGQLSCSMALARHQIIGLFVGGDVTDLWSLQEDPFIGFDGWLSFTAELVRPDELEYTHE